MVTRSKHTLRLIALEHICRFTMLLSLLVATICWVYKDKLPPATFYSPLAEPKQSPINMQPFYITTHQQKYKITPLYRYALEGMVVTYNDADQFGNIWHHKRWKDFINLRDICVVWGNNLSSGIYQEVDFHSDSWTCWAKWKHSYITQQFKMTELSNNHLLTTDPAIKRALLNTEHGDQIAFKGILVNYRNVHHGGYRKSSTRRDDTGNGACETVYLTNYQIIKKANPSIRRWFRITKWLGIISGIAWLILLMLTPPKGYKRTR